MRWSRLPWVLTLLVLPAPAAGQGRALIRERYTKHEQMIPMRDGVKLYTAIYLPKDRAKRSPILLCRTPYSSGPYGVDNYPESLGPSPLLAKSGYIFVMQDVRGRYLSEGQFVDVRPILPRHHGPKAIDESTDAYDTIDYLVRHLPQNNGRVGIGGISYPGFYAAAALVGAHPSLRAVSPQAPVTDWFLGDDFHHNGAFLLAPAFTFLANFGKPRPLPTRKSPHRFEYDTEDGYAFFLQMGPLPGAETRYFKTEIAFWRDLMQHGAYDAFWQERELSRHLERDIRPAVMTVGGWFDAEDLYGTLRVFHAVERSRPRAQNTLVMGPWSHGGWARSDGDRLGPLSFGSKTSLYFQEKLLLPFLDFHLKEAKGQSKVPKISVFETGTDEWHAHDTWPPRGAVPRSLCLAKDGRLSFGPVGDSTGYDEYVSDPAKPVPYTSSTVIGLSAEYMVDDQRFAATRPDVLAWRTEPLSADVTLVGPIAPRLFVSTSGTDSDFIVKLIDVYPDDYPSPRPNPRGVVMGGYQQLVRGAPFRGKFRRSFEKPEPFVPWRVEPLAFSMPDICHTFRRGHRIMVQVQSSWFPLVDRNPQKFVDIYRAKASDFQRATQRIYRTKDRPSCLAVSQLRR
jgi:uncharacterized protein